MIKKIVLFISFLILTVIYVYSFGNLTSIQTNLTDKSFSSINYGELQKGEVLEGSFVANNNWLGQVSIRFYNFNRINPDSVIFRIKEQGASSWYYENTYKTDQFQPNLLFSFGFPIISDSEDKKYDFQIESLNGLPEHSIGFSSTKPLGEVTYKYPKSYLLTRPNTLLHFIQDKIQTVGLNVDTYKELGIYLNYIILSLLLISLALNHLMTKRIGALFKIKSANVLIIGLLLLILSAFILYLKKVDLSYSITTLGYFVLVAGVIYAIVELKRE